MAVSVVKFGVALPWIFPKGVFRPETVTAAAKTCEESHWDSIWCGDHLLHLSGMEVPESWTLLTASATVTNKVRLGTCVTDPHRHHPAVLAQRLATIDHFSNGRVILGLGAGCSVNMDTFNIDWRNPVSKLEEYFQILKGLWGCEKFSHEGKHWSFKNAFLQIKPRQESIPIYFAANSPRTLGLTGKYADGWVPTGLTPSMYRKRLNVVREAARKAGRNPDDIDAGLYLGVCLADSAEKAKAMLGLYKTLLSPGTLAEAGYKIDFPEELREYSYVDWKPNPEYMNTLVEYMKFVPDEALSDFFVLGTADDCAEKIDEFIEAGVKHFVMDAVAEDYSKFVRDFGQVLSAVRD
jgi:alkanesulfonate monooxygenase SsuD/methylene tetrahydromethanopterin reductase-like flavin-dependent oxidoreductase (luciferase family)